jgi:nucleolar protein 9
MVLEIEADQSLSDEPGSLMDYVLVGWISASRTLLLPCMNGLHWQPSCADNDPPSVPITALLRDPTSSHLLETLVSRYPERVFGILWTTYFEGSLKKLAIMMHLVANFVIAKALERANAEQLSYDE